MTMAYEVSACFRNRLAGVTSVDGTCRPQFVPDDEPGEFAELLREARARWGVGAVLNTSFNIHGEPIVCSPAEAIDVFLRSGADALAIGPFLVERPLPAVARTSRRASHRISDATRDPRESVTGARHARAWVAVASAWVVGLAALLIWVLRTPAAVASRATENPPVLVAGDLCGSRAGDRRRRAVATCGVALDRRDILSMTLLSALALGLTLGVAPRTNRIYYDEQIYQNIGQNLADLKLAQMCNDGAVEDGRLRCSERGIQQAAVRLSACAESGLPRVRRRDDGRVCRERHRDGG